MEGAMVKVRIDGKEFDVPRENHMFSFFQENGLAVPGMCFQSEGDPYGACRLCLVEINGSIRAACTVRPSEDMEIETLSPTAVVMRRTALELMLSDHRGDCIAPCREGCPAHSDVQGYVALIAMGRYHEAVRLMKERYILPAVLGRVCPAFCEDECRRHLVDQPVAIRQAKRFAADYDLEHGPWMPDIPSATGKKVAVVGGGPAGLSCAYYLRVRGHAVTIFEAMQELGGMMRYGIPEYRLPKEVLDRDLATVTDIGIEVKTNCQVGKNVSLEQLQKEFDALFVATGAWACRKAGINGENLDGVMQGIDFLRQVSMGQKTALGRQVVVVGGGNTALDVARTALRLGAEVTLVYRRSMEEMPASKQEVKEAREEGVQFMFLTNPAAIHGSSKVEKVELVEMRHGEPDESGRRRPIPVEYSNFTVGADTVILAIGQYCDNTLLERLGLAASQGKIDVDDVTYTTNLEGVFAGGDAVLGPSTIIESIATGREAAIMIDLYLKDKLETAKSTLSDPVANLAITLHDEDITKALFSLRPYRQWKTVTEQDYAQVEHVPRVEGVFRSPSERTEDFQEVEKPLTELQVKKETQRCMSCGCLAGYDCRLRDYATLYGAQQDTYAGEQNTFTIDDSHPHVVLDNNKCVLCGQCITTTQQETGEGLLDFMARGFVTLVAPPVHQTLADVRGQFLGDLIDVCPTGAITERVALMKPGPWETTPVATICNGCGLGCEMNIETYGDLMVRASSKFPSWNNGHVCDRGRFERPWARRTVQPAVKTKRGVWKNITWGEATHIIWQHLENMAIVLTPEVTQEEAEFFKELAQLHRLPLGALVEQGVSTANYNDLLAAQRIQVQADVERYGYLKLLLRQVTRQGARLVDKDPDLLVVEAPDEPAEVPTLVLHRGVNETGLLTAGFQGVPTASHYLAVGHLAVPLDGYTVVLGTGDYADVRIPYPAWAEKEGTIINDLGMKLHLTQVRSSPVTRDDIRRLFNP